MSKIEDKINLARTELLDLSLRNPLLNYKLRVSSGLEFPLINPADVFSYIVTEGKKIFFTTEKSNNPSRLYTNLDEKTLRRRLLSTFRLSKMYLEEKGANILFLALGFLKWNERGSTNFSRAPLVLIPIELKRVAGQDKFYIEYSGEEIRLNVSLITKMQNDYQIDISHNTNQDEEISGIDEYFRKVDEQISLSDKEGWTVETDCGAFDFFSYAKFLMYKDLDLTAWSDAKGNIVSPVLTKLFVTDFSEKTPAKKLSSSDFAPYNVFNVVDADSSQAQVIHEVAKGRNLVIQGPPGTGKSQTITNIIASSLANGKSVLFVAEKKAALDVVKTRLETIGLSDLVLELHSQKTNKLSVLSSIESTLNLGAPKMHTNDLLKDKYSEACSEIDEYRNAVNRVLRKSQSSLIEIYGHALQIKDKYEKEGVRLPRINISPDISDWTDKDFKKKLQLVQEFKALLKNLGKLEKHNFYGVELKECYPYEQVTIKEKIFDLDDALTSFESVVDEIGSLFSNKYTNNLIESGRLINSIDIANKYKNLAAINIQDVYLYSHKSDLKEIFQHGKDVQDFSKKLVEYRENSYLEYNDFIETYDLYFHSKSDKIDKVELKNKLSSFLAKGGYNKSALAAYYDFMVHVRFVLDNEDKLRSLFKDLYKDIWTTNWNAISKMLNSSGALYEEIYSYKVIPQVKDVISNEDVLEKLLELKDEYFERKKCLEDKINDFLDITKFNSVKRFNCVDWYSSTPFPEFKKIISAWKNNVDSIVEIVRYNDLIEKFKKFGLSVLLDYYFTTGKYESLDDILGYEYYDSLINDAYANSPYLSTFKEYKLERTIENFREMDSKLMVENIKYILNKHYDKMPKIDSDLKSMSILRREMQKKKNQMPVRRLFSSIGDTLVKIKPVFMMSPISVASFLPPKSIVFDMVIFDEASQVRPVEAFGPLLRANQVVVVGDSKQLPPTTFFDTMTTKYDDMNDEDYDVVNMESILSLLLSKNIPERTLSWHYRSKNQSLISVSNNEFYNQTLKVFPSVYDKDPNQGLIYRYIPDGVYDRGGTRTNKIEAREVIKAVFKQVEENPNLSIGVVSFSFSQQEELYKEFEAQLKKHNEKLYNDYFDQSRPEPFFIKNLESVQGDERDIIFISIGYGYDANHKLTMDFGPLNKDGGERRLNVLITRAKYKCIVFSNLNSHDINLSKTSSVGVIALKRFIEYAQNRVIFLSKNQEIYNDAFTEHINNLLIDYGYDIDRNIGVKAGLDLAVYDKELNRFTVGIECDGGMYKDINSITDCERIRKNVLRSLGWKIYHIWAPDFYRNPRNEFEKLLDFIEESKKAEVFGYSQKSSSFSMERKQSKKLEDVKSFEVYKEYDGPRIRVQVLDDELALKKLIADIIKVESPINIAALKKEITNLAGVSKLSDKQNTLVHYIVTSDPKFEYRNDFVYKAGQEVFEVRNRENINKNFKKAEYIADEEYIAFIIRAIETGEATNKNEMLKAVPAFLGVGKSKYVQDKLDALIDDMIENKKIFVVDKMFYLDDVPSTDGSNLTQKSLFTGKRESKE